VICFIESTGERLERWRVRYVSDEGMDTETRHVTRIGARFSRWLWHRDTVVIHC
jgi:hypothetical protein